ncbi:MAG TPA: hypothetical protein VMW23_08015 [Sedimentisphaerales bacterium]|nr:hypothetical protein [Sedimentisphaerales bacterium]
MKSFLGFGAMVEKINTNQIPNFLDKTSAGQLNNNDSAPNNDPEVSLQVDYASFIESALAQTLEADSQAVQKAKQLLDSGRLDTEENITAAAEEIADFGI